MLKIIILFIILFMLSRAILRYKDRLLSAREMFFWIILWTISLFFIFNPSLSNLLARYTGIGRGADAAFLFSIILLFYLVFRIYVKIDKLDQDLTKLVIQLSKNRHKEQSTKN